MTIIRLLSELSSSTSEIDWTTSASLFHEKTKPNGQEWYQHIIVPGDQTKYWHVDGDSWDPVAMGPGRWFGNYRPKTQQEAILYYNLPNENPATDVYRFYFEIPEKLEKYCFFGSYETEVGHWQAKFPQALIPYVKILEKFSLE